MKLKDTDKIALWLLLGFGVCLLSIFYVAKPNYESSQSLKKEAMQLEARLKELQNKVADQEKYENGIALYTEEFNAILNAFPADLNQEITIMFLEGIKDTNDFSIESLGLGEKDPFYTLMSNGADATLAETDTDDSAESSELVESTGSSESGVLTCYKAEFPMNYTGSYSSLKDVVAYIDNYSDRMTVDELSISYTGENVYVGNIDLTCYSIEGESRPERSLELNQIEIGVDNIFQGGSGSETSDASLNKYDDQDGAAIEASYDFYTMLNASTSDVSAKIVGQNGTGKENTIITNSDNSVSAISYDFYEVDGKIYCKYTLDNSLSYEAEVTSAEDVKLLIQSSERKNDDDKVGVKIVIRNSTSLPVYIKVSGDDAVSPRVSITKNGLVKVYQ